jgi:mRNA interferase HigB
MIVISKRKINEFIVEYPKSAEPMMRWYLLCKECNWAGFPDLKKTLPGTDLVSNDLYVFNVGGNKFRIIARIIFSVRTIFIRFIGTHTQYDKVKLSDL